MELTGRQHEIWTFLVDYVDRHGYPPTVREIGEAVGLASPSTVHAHLANLEKIGMLRRDPTKPRAIELLVDKARRAVAPSGIPVVGQVSAGQPILAEENIEEYVDLPSIAGGDSGEYILRVSGDSMKDAGILGGDFVARIALPSPLLPGPHTVAVEASTWFVPHNFTGSGDFRPLAWRLGEVDLDVAPPNP